MPPILGHEESVPMVASPRKGPRGTQGGNPVAPSAQPGATEVRGGVYVISVAARILEMHQKGQEMGLYQILAGGGS